MRRAGTSQGGAATSAAAIHVSRWQSRAVMLLAALATIFFLDWAEPILLPLVASVVLSYALDPVLYPFDRLRVPRPVSAGIVMVLLLGLTAAATIPLQTQFIDLLEKVPAALSRFEKEAERAPAAEESVVQRAQELAEKIEKVAVGEMGVPHRASDVLRVAVVKPPFNISDFILTNSSLALMLLTQFFSMMFLVYFLLAIGNLYRRKLVRMAGPDFKHRREMLVVIHEFHRQVRRFLFITLVSGAFVGILTWLAYLWMGVEQAGFWGTIAGIASAVPYLGPFMVMLGTGAAAFVQFGSIEMAVVVAGVSLIITSIQGYLLLPLMTAHVSSLNTVAIFVGLLFWGWIWGPLGLIIATPLMMMMKTACDHLRPLRGVGELLGQ